ncbi:nucleoside-diphosphate kinase [Candidatus Poribacteria bacterium]
MERTLVIVKPDGVKRGLAGEIISRFEKRGLKITGLRMTWLSEERAEQLYAPHKGKVFYQGLVDFMTSGPVVAIAVEGRSAIQIVRNMIGALKPEEAMPGSIRGDYSMDIRYNTIHGSDSPESAERELAVFFDDNEFLEYQTCDEEVLYSE